jgi:beta-glucuronidase
MRFLSLILLLVMPSLAGDFDDSPDHVHAMEIRLVKIDGFPVVTHYGKIRPDFADRCTTPHRSWQSLDGAWHFRFDPDNVDLAQEWPAATDLTGWTGVTVPHCWDMMKGGRFWDWSDRSFRNPPFYDGVAWYRRDFVAPAADGKARRLVFLGIPHRVSIFLNGGRIALHEGGGQPFSLDVTDKLRPGSNTLAVRIVRLPNFREKPDGKGFDEIEYVHTRHPKAPDNWPYAGIPRSISLITEDTSAIRKVLVHPEKGTLQAAVCLSNEGDEARSISIALDSPAIHRPEPQAVRLAPGKMRVLRFNVTLKPDATRWSPANPALHTLTASASEGGKVFDTLRTNFGLRDFRIDGNRLLLDGEPVFLKGVAFYEEHAARGNALTAEDHEKLIQLVRDAGANFARLHVTERHPLTYELADRHGILLCAEWGGFWYKEKSLDAQTKDERSIFQSLARSAVWDLMNHPSIVLWGIHNESHQFCPEYEPFVKMGHQLVDELDWQQRPVTWAAWHPHQGEPHFEHADVVGFNEYRGALDRFEDLEPDLVQLENDNPGKPLMVTENGAWSRLGNRGPKHRHDTEDWQADLLRRQHEVLVKHIQPLAGYTYWLLNDYRSRKPYTGSRRADGWSRMGLYDGHGEPKLVRDVFRDLQWTQGSSRSR